MPGLASPIERFIPFGERIAREANSGMLPYLDLVEHGEANSDVDLIVIGCGDAERPRGRRRTPEDIGKDFSSPFRR